MAAKRYNNAKIIIDSAGVGDPILDDLRKANLRVTGFSKWTTEKDILVNDLALAIQEKKITYPEIPEMINELNIFTYEITPSRYTKYHAPEGYHDDIVMALCLAYRGLSRKIGNSAMSYAC